ncbi:TlpA family protein disulfide reductase [Hydrogenimonas sp.]
MKKTLSLLALAAALLLPSIYAQEAPATAPEQDLIMTLAAPGEKTLHIKHLDNGLVVQEYSGKVILINFFGKHCKWCMKEIPHLVKLQKEYAGKLQIIAVHAQQKMTPGERHMLDKKFHFNYPIYEYEENPEFVMYISHRTQWQGGLPFTVVFDAHGNYVYSFPGYASEEDLKKVIDFAIKSSEKKPATPASK